MERYYHFCPRLKNGKKMHKKKSRRVFCFLSIYRKVNVKYVTSFESALSSLGPFSGIWVRYSGVSDPPSVVTRRGVDPRRAADRGRARLALRLYATRVF